MGWKGTLRSIEASARRAERDAQRRRRELERQRMQLEKMQELERAAYEVQVYQNRVDLLLSVHKECSDPWDWERIRSANPPVKPDRTNVHEESAKSTLDNFKPKVSDRMLRRVDSKLENLAKAVEAAKESDERDFQEKLKTYEEEFADWESSRELATRVLSGDTEAYLDAIKQTNPFQDMAELGSFASFHAHSSSLIEADLFLRGQDVIPQETKGLLKSRKLSVKPMPKTKGHELHQDFLCSCVLRIARELFALLPIKMVIVNAFTDLLNTQTGHMERQPILSVAVPRETLDRLNFETLDPSDSLGNFVFRMVFSKTKGFQAIETIKPSDLQME